MTAPAPRAPSLRVRLPCADEQDFWARLAARIAEKGLAVPTANQRPVGASLRLALEFRDGTTLAREAVVEEQLPGARPAIRVRVLRLDRGGPAQGAGAPPAPPPTRRPEAAARPSGAGPVAASAPTAPPSPPAPAYEEAPPYEELFADDGDLAAPAPTAPPSPPAPAHEEAPPYEELFADAAEPLESAAKLPSAAPAPPPEAPPYEELFADDRDLARSADAEELLDSAEMEELREDDGAQAGAAVEPAEPTPPRARPLAPAPPRPLARTPSSHLALGGALAVGAVLVAGAAGWAVLGGRAAPEPDGTAAAAGAHVVTADRRIADGRLTGPDGALEHLLEAERLRPGDAAAATRLALLADTLEALGSRALARGDLAEAGVHLAAARDAAPERDGIRRKLEATRDVPRSRGSHREQGTGAEHPNR